MFIKMLSGTIAEISLKYKKINDELCWFNDTSPRQIILARCYHA